MGQIVFPTGGSGLAPEYIALFGVLASSLIGGVIAFLVSAQKGKADQRAFEAKMDLERESILRETRALKAERKLEIAHKYAELAVDSKDVADEFLSEIAKQTAIGFVYHESGDGIEKAKIWIRNDANILFGRAETSDVVVADPYVSRQHMFIHTLDEHVRVLPINPTNMINIDGMEIDRPTELRHQSEIVIGETKLIYFALRAGHPAQPL